VPTDDQLVSLDLQASLQHKILRAFFITVALVCVVGAAVAPLLGGPQPPRVRALMVVGYGCLAVLAAVASKATLANAQRLIGPVLLSGVALVGLLGVMTGWALQTPGLAFFAVAVAIAHMAGSTRLGNASLGMTLLVVLALALAERWGVVQAPTGGPPVGARAVVLGAALVASALIGRGMTGLMQQHLAVAAAREQRFRALLGIATSAYWETDASAALTQVSRRDHQGQFQPLPALLGLAPWALPQLQPHEAGINLLREHMAAQQPLRDLPLGWAAAGGAQKQFLVSGEPRHDGEGRFVGYWGVARDVTAEHQARDALRATETRYRAVFSHVPLPLMLHRRGVLLETNLAAAQLLGYDTVEALVGIDVVDRHVPVDDRAMTRARMSAVMANGGAPLPAFSQVLRTRDGRQVTVKVIATRTDMPDGPAALTIVIDETERQRASQALERSQALLAQVVSMSPDLISLTELPSGRYVMVNDSFERLLGYKTAEVIGRTSLQLGLWRDAGQRTALSQAISQDLVVRDHPVEMVTKQGRVIPLMISGTHVVNDGQAYALTNARDQTEAHRVRLEREAILSNASVGIAFTRNRRFEMANAHFEALFGWPSGSLIGQPGRVVWPSDADYEALGREIGPLLARGEAIDIERRVLRRDGSPFLLRMRAKAIDPHLPAESGTIWIAEDVTAERLADQELAQARDAAEAASQAKSAFLANTSHEIRTPLNGLTGLARLARQPGVPPERLHLYLEQIGESAELLSAIISDILDLSKIEAGKLDVETAPFDLGALLQSVQRGHAALAAGHGLSFEAQFDPALPTHVRGDALRLRQILSNYLHNALKFTDQGGIRLVVRPVLRPVVGPVDGLDLPPEAPSLLRFEVHDTGPGIAEAAQTRLFQPFTQADESTTRRFGGTGLGLSICRELARLMGGTVGLASVPGRGSCFHAELPLPAVLHDAPAASDTAGNDPRLHDVRVLLVEDNSVNMMIGVALLDHWGARVTEAADGAQALAAVERAAAAGQPFQVVLMDLQMPGMSGYQATEALRRQYDAVQLPVIALTAAALVSERERALAAGMNGFLTKPIDPQNLHRALLHALIGGRA
jgi:PAS domain S-box-containing protein